MTNPRNVRWPAEWETQDAVWLTWPHRQDLWAGEFQKLQNDFALLCTQIAKTTHVCINAEQSLFSEIRKFLLEKQIPESKFTLHNHAGNDVWCRDHGCIFVQDLPSGNISATDWEFNAWGGKFPPWDLDNTIAEKMAQAIQAPIWKSQMILEGGAIEGNGEGLLLTTESVLLNPNRNPHLSRLEIENELKTGLGVKEIFWLGNGIEGDDTDGHIDDMVRFVKNDAVVAILEKNSKSPHYQALQENWERLQDLKTLDGHRVEVIELPMPSELIMEDWRLEQLPASYANFLITNGQVIVPIFNQVNNDDKALGILREAFPNFSVTGIDARRLVVEGGAIHCITQQQPQKK